MENQEFHFEFVRGQHHYQAGGKKEDLQAERRSCRMGSGALSAREKSK